MILGRLIKVSMKKKKREEEEELGGILRLIIVGVEWSVHTCRFSNLSLLAREWNGKSGIKSWYPNPRTSIFYRPPSSPSTSPLNTSQLGFRVIHFTVKSYFLRCLAALCLPLNKD